MYQSIARLNQSDCRIPIYVGKAESSGRRIGRTVAGEQTLRGTLYGRLQIHNRSITRGDGLDVKDFKFKVIATEGGRASWGERILIEFFRPIWNSIIFGFGINAPGKRRPQERSMWDQIHPGRPYAAGLPIITPVDPVTLTERVNAHCQALTQNL